MIKPFLEVGQIVSTHGIKGEVRVQPWCDSTEFLKQFKVLYFDKKGQKSVKVLLCRPNGNIAIMKLDGIDTVEAASALRNKILFMDRLDVHIPDGTYFIQDLIDCRVYDADDESKCYGIISDVSQTGANDVWHIKADDGKEYLIPAIPPVVIETDVIKGIIKIKPLKGIFDNED